jgi:hypothetical protein
MEPNGSAKRPRRFGRRALLIGGAGVAAVAAAGAGPLLISGPSATGRRNLSATECASALALAETLFPKGSEPGLPSATEADVLGRLDEAVGYMTGEIRGLFKLGLRAFEYAPLPGYFSRFSALDAPRRAAVVRSWERSSSYNKQVIILSLRYQVGLAYFESDAARKACGWSLGCTPSTSAG